MIHRHLKTNSWTPAAIDSALERGNLKDWHELFAAARRNRSIAEGILKIASKPAQDGSTRLAKYLILDIYPDLKNE